MEIVTLDDNLPCSSKATTGQEESDEFECYYDMFHELYQCEMPSYDVYYWVVPPPPEVQYACGCCFAEYDFDKMAQSQDGHLFCLECAKRAAQAVIGLRKVDI